MNNCFLNFILNGHKFTQYYSLILNFTIHPSILLICLAELGKVISVRPDGQFAQSAGGSSSKGVPLMV